MYNGPMKSILDFSRKHPIITAIEAVLFCMASLLIIRPNAAVEGYGIADVLLRFLLAIVAGAFLHAVSGDKTFDCCDKKSLYVIKSLCPFWIMGIFLAVLMLITNAANRAETADGWLLKLNLMFIFCLAAGAFEETLFIAVINDAVLRQFRRLKWAFVLAAVIHSAVFGAVQLIGADFSTGSSTAAVLLKMISSVLFSLCMVILYWKTRNVWALALVRGIYEFFGMVPGTIFMNADIGGYAGTRGGITVSLVFFAIRTFVALIMLVLILKNALKGLDLTKLRREW